MTDVNAELLLRRIAEAVEGMEHLLAKHYARPGMTQEEWATSPAERRRQARVWIDREDA